MIRKVLHNKAILVVEDEYLIAMDAEQSLQEAGATVVGPAPSVAVALKLLRDNASVDGAVLDINLGGEKVFPVADQLIARNIPFMFTTGYEALVVPDKYRAIPRCQKPVNLAELVDSLGSRISN